MSDDYKLKPIFIEASSFSRNNDGDFRLSNGKPEINLAMVSKVEEIKAWPENYVPLQEAFRRIIKSDKSLSRIKCTHLKTADGSEALVKMSKDEFRKNYGQPSA